jgi:hypothetical protein
VWNTAALRMLSSVVIRKKTFPVTDCCLCAHSVRVFSCVSSVTASERLELPNVCSCNLPAPICGHHNLSAFPVLTRPPPSLPVSDEVKQFVLLKFLPWLRQLGPVCHREGSVSSPVHSVCDLWWQSGTSTFLSQNLSAITVHCSMFTALIRRTSGRSRGTFKQRNSLRNSAKS